MGDGLWVLLCFVYEIWVKSHTSSRHQLKLISRRDEHGWWWCVLTTHTRRMKPIAGMGEDRMGTGMGAGNGRR